MICQQTPILFYTAWFLLGFRGCKTYVVHKAASEAQMLLAVFIIQQRFLMTQELNHKIDHIHQEISQSKGFRGSRTISKIIWRKLHKTHLGLYNQGVSQCLTLKMNRIVLFFSVKNIHLIIFILTFAVIKWITSCHPDDDGSAEYLLFHFGNCQFKWKWGFSCEWGQRPPQKIEVTTPQMEVVAPSKWDEEAGDTFNQVWKQNTWVYFLRWRKA